jgi:hypothetical protein
VLVALLSACGGGGSAPDATGVSQTSAGATLAMSTASTSEVKPTALTLRASIAGFSDDAAILQVRINEIVVGTFAVRAAELADQYMDLPPQVDGGVLELVWLNTAGAAGRSVTVDQIIIGGISLSPLDDNVVFDKGDGPAALDGLDVLPGQRTLTSAGALRFVLPATGRSTAAAAKAGIDGAASNPGYFVDASLGNDSNPGTISKPWRTLARATTVRLTSGQGIYLRCGRTWRESLSLGAMQLVDGAIIAGYGSNCGTKKAVISGADVFSAGWTLSSGVWSRSLPANTPKITQLFIDGQPLRTAQWPNPVAAGARMALLAPASTSQAASSLNVSLRGNGTAALPTGDLIGATIQIRTQSWMIETRRVSGVNGTVLVLDKPTTWKLQEGQGYVLQDKRWMLDDQGEFFHDVAAQRLYLIAPAAGTPADLNKASIEGSVRDIALALTQRSSLTVRDLAMRAAREDGLRMTDTPQPRLERIEARDNMSAGVRLWQWTKIADATPGPSITDSLVAGNGQHGIDAQHVARAQIKRNRVLATGNAVQHVAGVTSSISAGPGASTEDNLVDGAGYIGISFSNSAGSVVARNTVSGYCARLSDCAAIYTWTGRNAPPALLASTVEGNRVLGAKAQMEGTTANASDVVAGIYIDDHSDGTTVRGNSLYGVPIGVLVHNASNVSVIGNVILQPALAGIFASMDQTDADWMKGNTFSDNQIVPLVQARAMAGGLPSFASSQAVWFLHSLAGANSLAAGRNVFSRNTVVQLQGPVAKYAWVNGPEGERFIDAQEWTLLNAGESSPQRPLDYTPLLTTLGPELVLDGQFDMDLSAWRTWRNPVSRGGEAQPLAGALGCDGACMRFTSGHIGDLLISRPFAMRAGAPHVYRWTAAGLWPTTAAVGTYISREGSPWDAMADSQGLVGYSPLRSAGAGPLSYESYFVAKASDAARVNLALDTANVPVTFDKVSVREVTGYTVAAATNWSALAHAPMDTARSIGCAELGWDTGCTALGLDGQPVTLPLTLAAGTQRLLMRGDSPFRR